MIATPIMSIIISTKDYTLGLTQNAQYDDFGNNLYCGKGSVGIDNHQTVDFPSFNDRYSLLSNDNKNF